MLHVRVAVRGKNFFDMVNKKYFQGMDTFKKYRVNNLLHSIKSDKIIGKKLLKNFTRKFKILKKYSSEKFNFNVAPFHPHKYQIIHQKYLICSNFHLSSI
jgi:hypothetical protein